MMRGPRKMAVAVRRPDNSIVVHSREVLPWGERYPVLKLPLVRGVVAVIEALALGINALMYSANQAVGEDEEPLTRGQINLTMAVSIVLSVLLFVVLPTWLIHYLETTVENTFLLNLLEGFLRMGILAGYIFGISLMPDIRRVLEYHGAEHKVIHAWEAGDELTVENARRYPRLHPRCGTSFLLMLAMLSVFLFAFTGWPSLWQRLAVRLGFFPLVAGVSYEVIRLAGRKNPTGCPVWLRPFIAPGLWFQRMTTREPDEGQLEVAIAALGATLEIPASGVAR